MKPEVCEHHWLIEPPRGPTSEGRCKNCGEERAFYNSERSSHNPPRTTFNRQPRKRDYPGRLT